MLALKNILILKKEKYQNKLFGKYGINDIHKENVVHLDLKPSNILIDNYGFIKIADFGVSIQTPAVSYKAV